MWYLQFRYIPRYPHLVAALFREWCELNGINPHTPTVPMMAEFMLHLFRDKQLTTIKVIDRLCQALRFLPGFIAKTQKPDRPDTALSPVIIPALAPSSVLLE